MPALLGFSNNPFQSREDVLRAATALLNALMPYKSPCGARVKIPIATGTGFDEVAAQLEGFARPMWIVADLLARQSTNRSLDASGNSSPTNPVNSFNDGNLDLESWARGLVVGVDPQSDTFWGHLDHNDQRMVEMEPIAYALLTAPSVFLPTNLNNGGLDHEVNEQKKTNIVAWLRSINEKEMPPSNWRWFRVLVNLALVKVCGVPYQEVKPIMDSDLKILDSFYLGDGWSSDGLWCEDKKQADYYSGSFAIQYSQLVYVRFAHDIDPERVERYRGEAKRFSETFWRYFDVDGAAIPFGRSLTYRFAFAAFWSAVVVADVNLPPPLNQLGAVKGLLLRHLRWWRDNEGIFNVDGTFTIGYTYPNMYMSEDYNSPQSPYWCLKAFSVLGLTDDHPFWRCEELPHPLFVIGKPSFSHELGGGNCVAESNRGSRPTSIEVIAPTMHITCGFREHHFLLSSGQFTKKTHRSREAKYGKFAYSSAFAFSVPTGSLLQQIAPDSTLSISNDDGETWRVRWEPIDARVQVLELSQSGWGNEATGEAVPILISKWQPWKASALQVETILVPPIERRPGWHVRVHKLTWPTCHQIQALQFVDAGFAISGQGATGRCLPQLSRDLRVLDAAGEFQEDKVATEGVWDDDCACLVLSDAGVSGVCDLSNELKQGSATDETAWGHWSRGSILKPEANTNLISQRTLIPTVHHHFNLNLSNGGDRTGKGNYGEMWFATGVFAVASSARLELATIREMWQERPVFHFDWFRRQTCI